MAHPHVVQIDGLTHLLKLLSSGATGLELLAPTCNALLNLSSFLPIQVPFRWGEEEPSPFFRRLSKEMGKAGRAGESGASPSRQGQRSAPQAQSV